MVKFKVEALNFVKEKNRNIDLILTELKLAITTEAIKRLREGKRDSFYSNEICEIIDKIGAKIIKENEELKKLYQSN